MKVEFLIAVGLFFMVAACGVLVTAAFGANLSYDHRALVIHGKRRVLISGSIHYPRSTPEMWPDLVRKSKDGGLDVIETYVFWDLHEPSREKYDFKGRKDQVKFVKLVAEAGLYAHLRIGPYVCAEWNYCGFPVWLHFIPGIKFRTDNEPFKVEMKRFTTKIVDMMKQHKLYASQGGPIILSQIENEYGNVESVYGPAAKTYVDWAATMATSLNTGVPWVMCEQDNAPDPIINTCNGFYCDKFTPNSDKKPKMWTENWTGWFLPFGGAVPYRPVEDIAFAVARFYQRGGTFQNYYMYHGGTSFGRTTGGPFFTTSYDYDAPLDEYGIPNQPKWGHLKDLHKAIKLCEAAMVATDPTHSNLGPGVEVTVYETDSGLCAAFLANIKNQSEVVVNFSGNTYHLPAWSVSILPDCKNVVFNTAQINSVHALPIFLSQAAKDDSRVLKWSSVSEPVGISVKSAFTKMGLAEQLNTTGDRSDYLWYSLSIDIKGEEQFLQDDTQTVLHVDSQGHIIHVFVNGKHAGNGHGSYENATVSIDVPVTLTRGTNKLDLLSATMGLKNYGAFFDLTPTGITGVQLKGSKDKSTVDLSSKRWTYQIGLRGEGLGLHSGSSSLWASKPALPKNQTLTWYKTIFDAPAGPVGDHPIALDLTGMGKGEAWVNGHSIGRYWPTNIAPNTGCVDFCDYRGRYDSDKCLKYCGLPSQILYHVPRSWLKPKGNVLVLFEEMGGDPTHIFFASREVGMLCANVSETYPVPIDKWISDPKGTQSTGPTVSLECPYPNQTISSIQFASYGSPSGKCGSFSHGQCSSPKTLSVVQKACIGLKSCRIAVSNNLFGDPCIGVTKRLAIEALCS